MNGFIITPRFWKKKKKKTENFDGAKPQEWLDDEVKIKEGSCSFHVRYLGNIEVYESRGMQVCEEAIRALRKSKKKPQKAFLYVTGDALRVSDDVSQHLIVDQTIEKVSFCAPDRNHDKGFAYICRDGATRRWMCHAFLAIKESGERLSHAVGCAFAICLEKKQKRERDALQSASSEDRPFARTGSVRPASLAERLIDPQSVIPSSPLSGTANHSPAGYASPTSTASPVSLSRGTIARPRPSSSLLDRQGSLRLFPKLQDASPFKRDLSLRLAELPSNLQRLTRTMNGHTIPEENGTEQEPGRESSNVNKSSPVSCVSQPSVTSMDTLPAASPLVQSAAPLSFPHVPPPVTLEPIDGFTDPFSAAPFDQAAIQQAVPRTVTSVEADAMARLSLSSQTTPSNALVPVTHATPSASPVKTHAQQPVSHLAVNPSVTLWSTHQVPCFSEPNPVYSYTLPSSHNLPQHSPVMFTPNSNPYAAIPSYPFVRPTWTPCSNLPTQDWCAPLPSLLPPEPNRFTDPFDVAWAERATACLIPTSTHPHKHGNPFIGPQQQPQPSGDFQIKPSATKPSRSTASPSPDSFADNSP